MEFFRFKKDIPFMSYGKVTTSISLVTFILAIFFLATKGLNFGVDFTGGTVMEVHYAQIKLSDNHPGLRVDLTFPKREILSEPPVVP